MVFVMPSATAIKFDFGDNNGFHFDTGDLPTIGVQGPPGPPGPRGQNIEFAHLVVIVHVTDNIGRGYVASDFHITIKGNH